MRPVWGASPDRSLLGVIFLIALLVRAPWLVAIDGPGYLDAAYSDLIGRELAAGHGLSEPIIWHWLRLPEAIVHPSHDYWMPLEAVLVAGSVRLLGERWPAPVLPNLVLSAALAPVAAWLAGRWGASRREAAVAAGLALVAGPYAAHWTTTDPMAVAALVGSLALICADRPGWRWAFLGGSLAGLGQLARAEGFLLLATILIVRSARREWRAAALAAAAYGLVVAPWAARNLAEFGVATPAGLATIWLTEYNDLFRPGGASTAEWMARGLGAIATEKMLALGLNLGVLALLGHLFLTPFALGGLLVLRRRQPAPLVYLALLLVAMSLVFTFPGARGGFAHGLAALVPAFAAATVLGLQRFSGWLARRRRLDPTEARQRIALIALSGSLAAGLGLGWQQLGEWRAWRADLGLAAAEIRAQDPGAVVMVADPATYAVLSGTSAIVMPNLPPSDAVALARRYQTRFVLVGDAYPRAWSAWLTEDEAVPGVREVGSAGQFRLFEILP